MEKPKIEEIKSEYFEWLYKKSMGAAIFGVQYYKLFTLLHSIEFKAVMKEDEARSNDGISLRAAYAYDTGQDYSTISEYLDDPCSVLEMMLALAIKEEDIMNDPRKGDRTKQWLWMQIGSMGIGGNPDYLEEKFPESEIREKVSRMINREYSPDGDGGLFKFYNPPEEDLTKIDIWKQMCWYLNTLC